MDKALRSDTDTQDDAIGAAVSILREEGLAAVSFRSIAKRTGIHPATLHFRYGTKQALLDELFSVLVEDAMASCRELEQLVGRTKTEAEATELYRHAICGGGEPARNRDLALIEMLIAAIRDQAMRSHTDKWINQRHRCWAAAFSFRSDCDDLAWFLTELQIGLRVAGIGCGRPAHVAVLNGEIVARVLSGAPQGDRTWFSEFFSEARDRRFPGTEPSDETAERGKLLKAGAEIVGAGGTAALTFRSVAGQSGVHLSTAIRTFPSRIDLITAVFNRISEVVILSSLESGVRIPDEAAAATYFINMMVDRHFGGANKLFALTELYVAAARHPGLHDLAWSMRLTQGNDYDIFSIDPHGAAAFDTYIMNLWIVGCLLTHAGRVPDTRSLLSDRVPRGLRLLAPRVPWGAWEFPAQADVSAN